MKRLFKGLLIPLSMVIFSVFSGGAWADQGHVWELVKQSFPTPYFITKPDVQKPLPLVFPPVFKSGHGEFVNVAAGSFEVFEPDDPLGR